MDAGESSVRQRNLEYPEPRTRRPLDWSYKESPAMATATTLISPNTYPPHQPFPSAFPPAHPDNMPSMISPAESRRTSDESDPQRQSLPSIREVISGTKPPPYSSPVSSSAPPAPSLPRPFAASVPNPLSEASPEKHPSPRTLHPASFPPSRPDLGPSFSEPSRPPLSSRPPAPPQPSPLYPGQQPSPPVKMEHVEAEHQRQQAEAQHQYQLQQQHQLPRVQHQPPQQPHPQQPSGGYPHQPPHTSPLYPQTGQLPFGQRPLPTYPTSPRQSGPPLSSPYDSQRPQMYEPEEFSNRGGTKYETTLDRAFEAWSYGDALHRISGSARTIFGWADAFNAAAREQHGAQPIPSRLPTEDEVTHMLDNVYMVKKCLEDVRLMVQQSRMNERARDAVSRKGFEEEDPAMFADSLKPNFGMADGKKRRGRAAPPGRCHSCNRIDTPEWRRGPDGARTLCNACGLHYAKLERKRQLEQRSIRPKPADERS